MGPKYFSVRAVVVQVVQVRTVSFTCLFAQTVQTSQCLETEENIGGTVIT